MRAVECLVVCGLPAQPVTVDGVAGFVGAGESYRPEVLQSYPPTTGLGDLLPGGGDDDSCLLYTSPSPRDATLSRMPSSA